MAQTLDYNADAGYYQGVYANQNQAGYANQNQGGYPNPNQGGYPNQNQGGYSNQNQQEYYEPDYGRQHRGSDSGQYEYASDVDVTSYQTPAKLQRRYLPVHGVL